MRGSSGRWRASRRLRAQTLLRASATSRPEAMTRSIIAICGARQFRATCSTRASRQPASSTPSSAWSSAARCSRPAVRAMPRTCCRISSDANRPSSPSSGARGLRDAAQRHGGGNNGSGNCRGTSQQERRRWWLSQLQRMWRAAWHRGAERCRGRGAMQGMLCPLESGAVPGRSGRHDVHT
ncbi:unnamed protein product [Phaeothamnion confervicola]